MAAVASGGATAQPEPAPSAATAPTPLAEITNTATRTDRPTDGVPATVTSVTAAQAEARAARDVKDLFRHEVDVTVRAAAPRFGAALAGTGRAGNEGLNIRGLEGNQVLMLVDGVRVPQAFTFGAFAAGRGDYLFIEGTAAAEVLRGPASTTFGSDGLAGALVLRTLDPADVLRAGRRSGGFARLGATTVDDSATATGAYAWRGDPGTDGSPTLEGLVLVSARQGEATRSQGRDDALDARRTAPNPARHDQTGVLVKLGLAATPGHRLGLTLEAVQRRVRTEVLSGRTAPPVAPAVLPGTAVIDLDADDRIERTRGSLRWRYDDLNAPVIQQAEAQVYLQASRTLQTATEDRLAAVDRLRTGTYRERVAGFTVQAQGSLAVPVPQRLSAGLDASDNRLRAVRDGTVPPAGESFPSRPFPDTVYRQVGAFVQTEAEIGAVTVIPALRFDHFTLDASPDGYVGAAVADLSGQAVTPRLGLLWRVATAVQPYLQWSRGFRAPTPDQVNNGFVNPTAGYTSIGNPDLRPERAESLEVGVRGRIGTGLRWQVAAYDNRYRDFISQQVVRGSFRPADPAVFQFVNLDDARIRGAEGRLTWAAMPGLDLRAAAAVQRGRGERAGVRSPLASIEPARVSLGASLTRGTVTWRADVLHARAKDPADIPTATPPGFAPPASTVLDLGASWRPTADWTVHVNLDNALDATYWRWSDVRGLAATSPVRDAFTAPPRTVSVAVRRDF